MKKGDRYLLRVDKVTNANYFVSFTEDEKLPLFIVEEGRVGSPGRRTQHPIRSWDRILRKYQLDGYEDMSYLRAKATNSSEPTFIGPCADIMNELMGAAKKAIEISYIIDPKAVTKAMIDNAKKNVDELSKVSTIEEFNELLNNIFKILPRKMNCISNYLAKTSDDFNRIIIREQDLLDNMRAVCSTNDLEENSQTENLFDTLGIQMRIANDEEVKKVVGMIDNRVQAKVKRVWFVNNTRTQKAYKNYVETNKIDKTMLLWHGSRTENWFSIIKSGLLIRPAGAAYTGSMFGDGIYFATKASKSFNYTSYRGSYWAGGTSDKAYMALYQVASGTPYDVYSHDWDVGTMTLAKLRQKGNYNCLFAHAGTMLLNDEIIFYDPSQVTIRYLVEFE